MTDLVAGFSVEGERELTALITRYLAMKAERDRLLKELERTLIALTGESGRPVSALLPGEYLADAAARIKAERDRLTADYERLRIAREAELGVCEHHCEVVQRLTAERDEAQQELGEFKSACLHWRERAEQAEARVAKLEEALRNCLMTASMQLVYKSRQTCEGQSKGWRTVMRLCEEAGVKPSILRGSAALSAPGQPEGTSEPSDFDALLEHHKATEAENALFKRALEYIVRRGYHGASYVADNALAGVDVSAPGQPEGER